MDLVYRPHVSALDRFADPRNLAGAFETTYTIFVTFRSAFVSIIRDGQPLAQRIALAGPAVGTAVAGSTFFAAVATGPAGVLELFNTATAARRTTVMLPSAPVATAALPHAATPLVAVALRDCSVLVYNGADPVSRHTTAQVVLGMYGGAACSCARSWCYHREVPRFPACTNVRGPASRPCSAAPH